VIFSHINICSEKRFKEPNNGVHEQESFRLRGNKAGKIPFVPAIFSVLRISADFAPCPGVKMYRLTSTLCQPLSLSYFGCPRVPSRIKYCWLLLDHSFVRVKWTYIEAVLHLKISSFRKQKLVLLFGLDSSLIKQSKDLALIGIRSDVCNYNDPLM
jgi:hypothetical protein